MEQAHTPITKVRAMTKRSFLRRLSILPPSALFMACASDANSQSASQTAADTPQPPLVFIREGDFEQNNIRMTACPAAVLSQRHPDIQYSIDLVSPDYTVSAAPKDDKTALLWRVVVKSTGPTSSHAALHAA